MASSERPDQPDDEPTDLTRTATNDATQTGDPPLELSWTIREFSRCYIFDKR